MKRLITAVALAASTLLALAAPTAAQTAPAARSAPAAAQSATTTPGLRGEAPAAAARPAVSVPDCTGYPEHRVWLETHSWWIEKGEAFPGRHIHLGTCFPLGQLITGPTLGLDVYVLSHNQPGTITYVRASRESVVVLKVPVNWPCAVATCEFPVLHMNVPLASETGNIEIRLTANIDHNAFNHRQYNTTRWRIYHSSTSGGYVKRSGAAGWYDGYENAYLEDAFALRLAASCVSGVQTFTAKGDSGDKVIVAVDPNSHAGDPGLVLTPSGGTYTLDTSQLEPGWHKLFVRDEHTFTSAGSAHGIGMGAGQFIETFCVT